MASQSTTTPHFRWTYDVYLSFNGHETPKLYTAGLCLLLARAGICVFRDKEELNVANDISTSRCQAIKASTISIIVFSKYYADTKRCLRDEEIIMEFRTMGQVVLPLLYPLDPLLVRSQTGYYGPAFQRPIKRSSDYEVNAWRAALAEAASSTLGPDLLKFRFFAGNVLDVVEDVTSLLDSTDLFIAEHPVGVKSRVQDVIQLLNCQNSKDVLLLGIWGMGGSGKTTIAKAVYNQISRNFEGRKFLPEIRELWGKDPVFLQVRLLKAICKIKKVQINSIESGMVMLKEKLHGKRVFLVLDNVNELDQLNALCGSREWFGPGSRIIITTRNKSLLNKLRVDHVYQVKEMDYNESVELFSCYAFNNATPPENFSGLAKDVVAYCRGLPLALVALGYELFGREVEEWQSVLDGLKIYPHPEVQKVLKLSFDGLSDKEKEMFLEIASFLIGMDRNDAMQTLNSFGKHSTEVGINVLEEQSLITIDEKNKLQMHPLLREMGIAIIRQISESEPKQGVYDVFLSFRGKDTRPTFTSHLHASLQNAGIYVFKDDDELPRGEQISISLLKAIGQSKMSIIILSTNYADSRWCLQELENIMVCHRTKSHMIIPVFYGVDPSEVRYQTGKFGEAFEKLIKGKRISVEEDKVLRWRMALREVGNLSGTVVVNSRDESVDIKKVIEDVTRLLDKTELFVATHPVGVTTRVDDVIEKLNNQRSKDVILIGIWGMGGLGKTTIAKAIYNQFGRNFECRSFLLNIREVWEMVHGPVVLQQQLLEDVYKTTKMQIHDVESGKNTLKERLTKKKVFIVLDDVNKSEQLNALCGNHEWFGKGSAIIITTRDKHLLDVHGVDCTYVIEQLNKIESLELFSRHAFKDSSPKKDFEALSEEVVAYCQGLPLALEVLGSYLLDREIQEWKSALEKLKTIPHDEVQKKLKISFEGLSDYTQKEIFLDIACFFIGMNRNDVVPILNGCGLYAEIGISVLIERSLVTVDTNNNLEMHDMLRDMGRAIIREISPEPQHHSRLWYYEEVLDVLEKDKGTTATKGLTLKLPRTETIITLSTEVFKEMKNLKLLQLAGVEPKGEFKYFSKELRWMHWHGFPLRHIPADYYKKSLVSLELEHSNLNLLWKKAQMLEKLKILNLSYSQDFRETPDFSKLPNLEKLELRYCTKLTSIFLSEGQLKEILLIDLEGCTSLSNLPRSIYKLKSLKTLILSGCTNIDKLEEDMEQMEALTVLKADSTAITQVPTALARMKDIGYISMCGFEGLARDVMPSIIWSWTSPSNKFSSLVQTFVGVADVSLDVVGNSTLPAKYGSVVSNMNTSVLIDDGSQVTQMNTSALLIDGCNQGDNFALKNPLPLFSIQMGMKCPETEILSEYISQKLRTTSCSDPEDCLLPGDNKNPYWLTFNGQGSDVTFHVPQVNERSLKAMMVCIVYSSSADIITSEGLIVIMKVSITNDTKMINYTYDGKRLKSLKDEDWQRVVSNVEPGDKVQVLLTLRKEIMAKETAVYLIYDEPIEHHATASDVSDDSLNKHILLNKGFIC